MNYLVHPSWLTERAKTIKGFNMIEADPIRMKAVAEETAEEWTNDWPDGEGFGSSDHTFMLKDFIDTLIYCEQKSDKFKTGFFPSTLEVVKK